MTNASERFRERRAIDLLDQGVDSNEVAWMLGVNGSTIRRIAAKPPPLDCDRCGCTPTRMRTRILCNYVFCVECHRDLWDGIGRDEYPNIFGRKL